MSQSTSTEVLTEYAHTSVRVTAIRLSRRPEFCRTERSDIEQELLLYLLSRADQFDPDRASVNTFVRMVVATGARMLVRKQNRQKRRPGDDVKVESLETLIDEPGKRVAPLHETISAEDLERRTGAKPHRPQEQIELSEALEHAIETLPDQYRDVCRQLMHSPRAVAVKSLQISQGEFSQAIAVISAHFRRHGLKLPS